MESPFSVLSQPYCNYFYLVTIILYVWLIISALKALFFLYSALTSKGDKTVFTKFYVSLIPFAAFFILYFKNRLFYSMCTKSLT